MILEGRVGCEPVVTITFSSDTVDIRKQTNIYISCQLTHLQTTSRRQDVTSYYLRLSMTGVVEELCSLRSVFITGSQNLDILYCSEACNKFSPRLKCWVY